MRVQGEMSHPLELQQPQDIAAAIEFAIHGQSALQMQVRKIVADSLQWCECKHELVHLDLLLQQLLSHHCLCLLVGIEYTCG